MKRKKTKKMKKRKTRKRKRRMIKKDDEPIVGVDLNVDKIYLVK